MRSSRLVFEWLLSTLEIGRGILAIRQSLARLYPHYHPSGIDAALESLRGYFDAPSPSKHDELLLVLQQILQDLYLSEMPEEKAQFKRFRTLIVELALIRTVLLNSGTFPLMKEDSCR